MTRIILLKRRRRNVIGTTPDLNLLLAVEGGGLRLVQA